MSPRVADRERGKNTTTAHMQTPPHTNIITVKICAFLIFSNSTTKCILKASPKGTAAKKN
jgi:hypothetical protein